MKKTAYFLFSFLLFLSSCGISGFEEEYKLNPPLGLTATTISNQILLSFWAYNPRSYFSGFTVFMAASEDDLNQNKGVRIPNEEHYSERSTLWQGMQPMTEPKIFYYRVTEDLINGDQNNKELLDGFNYYFSVRAYSEQYRIYSKDSNITNVVFSNQ